MAKILRAALWHDRLVWTVALLLALAYGGLSLGLVSIFSDVPASPVLDVLERALRLVLRVLLQGWMILLLGYAILSWVQPHSPVLGTLDRLCAPLLRPIRRVVPPVGGVDLFAPEDMTYARRLVESGVATECLLVPGAFHAFDRIAPDTPQAQQFTRAKLAALRRAFAAT